MKQAVTIYRTPEHVATAHQPHIFFPCFFTVHLVKLYKDDGVNYFQTCSTISEDVDGGLRRIDFVAVDVDARVAFKASLDADMLSSARNLLRSDEVEAWARTAFTTSSTNFW